MTRTERNQYPAALLKDRHSRSGLTKSELSHKGGYGAHNWGSLSTKAADEAGGVDDAQADAYAIAQTDGFYEETTAHTDSGAGVEAGRARGVFGLNELVESKDEGDKVSELRILQEAANGLGFGSSAGADTEAAIAQSPSESLNSLDSRDGSQGGGKLTLGGRRMSNVSDEERERARVYREGAMHKGGIDLAHIARTSYGIAHLPPATSPTKTKNGFNFAAQK